VLEDVTARRAAESAPGDMQAQLEERVRIRTRDLEHAARELEAFSFSLSHDLRAPLRIVEGFAEILSEDYGGKLDTLGNDHLKRIRNAATRMNQMITALLKMAKTTNAPLAREPIDLSMIAEELLNELAHETPQRPVKVTIAPHIRVNADRVLMRNVMQNLLGNAWKFSAHAREARIEFGVAAEFGPETYFVRDNGAGFDMKYIDRLFAAFQRLHSQSEFAGTGIGLATVQRIINRHGGKIWARAEINKGATFYFTLADTVSSGEPAQLRR
jgi:light-regulated signal transduction histidine kinase (bacteriophytochrome)